MKVRFRLTDGRQVQLFHKSEIEVEPELWDEKKECYKAKCVIEADKRASLNKAVADRKNDILKLYNEADKNGLDSSKFEEVIDRSINPGKYKDTKGEGFFESFDMFLAKRKMSDERKVTIALDWYRHITPLVPRVTHLWYRL